MYFKYLRHYLDDLAAKKSAPGGGSACALSAGLGVALISMVINFTLGKQRYAVYEKELKKILKESEYLRKEFLRLVDLDVVAYKSKDIRKALSVPLKICGLCVKGMLLCEPLLTKSNKGLISDVAVAAVLLEASFAAAYYNVEINLKYLGKPLYAQEIRKKLKLQKKQLKNLRYQTEVQVGKIIRG